MPRPTNQSRLEAFSDKQKKAFASLTTDGSMSATAAIAFVLENVEGTDEEPEANSRPFSHECSICYQGVHLQYGIKVMASGLARASLHYECKGKGDAFHFLTKKGDAVTEADIAAQRKIAEAFTWEYDSDLQKMLGRPV
jgi:hypothetical protein